MSDVKDLDDGDKESIYIYSKSCPTEIYPINEDFERGDTILGLIKLGKLPTGGSYLHLFHQSDLKINPLVQQLVMAISVSHLTSFWDSLNSYLN